MLCKDCDKTDKLVCELNPPRIKCVITGESRYLYDECNVIVPHTKCIICGEQVGLKHENDLVPSICDKCKSAILGMRILKEYFLSEDI